MSSEKELRATQKRMLYHLLASRQSTEAMEIFISQLKTEMDAEDFAFVEKEIQEKYNVKKS